MAGHCDNKRTLTVIVASGERMCLEVNQMCTGQEIIKQIRLHDSNHTMLPKGAGCHLVTPDGALIKDTELVEETQVTLVSIPYWLHIYDCNVQPLTLCGSTYVSLKNLSGEPVTISTECINNGMPHLELTFVLAPRESRHCEHRNVDLLGYSLDDHWVNRIIVRVDGDEVETWTRKNWDEYYTYDEQFRPSRTNSSITNSSIEDDLLSDL